MFHYSVKITARRISVLFLFYLGLRLAFYIFNQDAFEAATPGKIFFSFLHGLRFDAAALLTINLPFIALSILPGHSILSNQNFQRFVKYLFTAVNTAFIFINLLDIEYFKFIGRRTSNEIFTITQDITDQAGHLAVDYWYIIFTTLLLGFLLFKAFPRY